MKKFSILSATLMVGVALALVVSCQKESSATTQNDATVVASEGRVAATAGVGPYAGSIQSTYAASLADNFAKKFDGQSQAVAFKAKDLISFLTNLQNKYKSDVIYVNFGVYGRGAAPVDSKDYGKLTVFFSGNKTGSEGNKRTDDGPTNPNDPSNNDQYLNHGGIWP